MSTLAELGDERSMPMDGVIAHVAYPLHASLALFCQSRNATRSLIVWTCSLSELRSDRSADCRSDANYLQTLVCQQCKHFEGCEAGLAVVRSQKELDFLSFDVATFIC